MAPGLGRKALYRRFRRLIRHLRTGQSLVRIHHQFPCLRLCHQFCCPRRANAIHRCGEGVSSAAATSPDVARIPGANFAPDLASEGVPTQGPWVFCQIPPLRSGKLPRLPTLQFCRTLRRLPSIRHLHLSRQANRLTARLRARGQPLQVRILRRRLRVLQSPILLRCLLSIRHLPLFPKEKPLTVRLRAHGQRRRVWILRRHPRVHVFRIPTLRKSHPLRSVRNARILRGHRAPRRGRSISLASSHWRRSKIGSPRLLANLTIGK